MIEGPESGGVLFWGDGGVGFGGRDIGEEARRMEGVFWLHGGDASVD